MENVCRNGTLLLNLTQHGRGDLDPEVIGICKDVGAWLKTNGEAVYGSRPFEVFGEDFARYTRRNGNVYVALLDWNGRPVTLKALRTGGATLGKVSAVELLGSEVGMSFVQDTQGLSVKARAPLPPLPGITDPRLASAYRILRITHDKGWINDDDPGAAALGWTRLCNLGTGDFNNDLTTSDTPGDVWSCSFVGNRVSVVAPQEPGAGAIEVQIDGKTQTTVDLSTTGTRRPQQTVFEATGLSSAQHTLSLIHRGSGPVAVDALVVR
jgi:alpha-L-fucosidase